MKNIYIKISSGLCLLILMLASNEAFGQKNLKLRITRIAASNTAGTDCDANCIGTSNNQLDWCLTSMMVVMMLMKHAII